ncbi:late competence development ComFB family protein [Tumidithrix helvetica PCC 7403]|uniref:late competence development ComFB family protein n=1 Tax=Tumidithrix helvetica TaxID=3457545 RepID=UPI003C8B6E99
MHSCRNAIEELVIEETKAQIARLSPERVQKIDPSEVVAHALNRLPPMYATTKVGWLQQRKRALNELKQQIESAVRRALVTVKPDALRDSTPLPAKELENQARSLSQVQDILGISTLTWKDVPEALENALMTVKLKSAVSYTYLNDAKRSTIDVQDYIRRSRVDEINWKGRQTGVKMANPDKERSPEAKDFATYMLSASYSFSNVLEKLVLSLAFHQVQKLNPTIGETIDLGEVVAYVLNRLPPMYATTERGYRQLRLRAREVHGKQVVETINEAIRLILDSPNRTRVPLALTRYEAEQEEALEDIKWILKRDDINWRNVATIIEESLGEAIFGEIEWQRRPQKAPNSWA